MKNIYYSLLLVGYLLTSNSSGAQCTDSFSAFSVVTCDTYTVPSGDETYTTDGIYMDTIPNFGGCDSIMTITLDIISSSTASLNISSCDSYTVPSGDETYTVDGIYMDTIPNFEGCDSVLTITVDISYSSSSSLNIMACNTYTVPSGDETYTADGVYMDTIPNVSGCDSIMTITLDIVSSSTASLNISSCESYTVPSGDETYTVDGVYMDTIPNFEGCDSIMTITVDIINASASSISVTECDSYTVPSGNATYLTSGVYLDTIPNFVGCDSVITITLTINYSTGSYYEATSCFSHTYNSQTYTTSGMYTQTLTNSVGCDSVITLNLTIHQVDISVTQTGGTFAAAGTGIWFQWLYCDSSMAQIPGAVNQEFTPTANGNYAVVVMNLFCSDTSACYNIDNVGISKDDNSSIFTVYPNPTTGEFTLSFLNPVENATIRLVSLSGQILTTITNMNGTNIALDLSGQADGVYIIEVITEGSAEQIRILKK